MLALFSFFVRIDDVRYSMHADPPIVMAASFLPGPACCHYCCYDDDGVVVGTWCGTDSQQKRERQSGRRLLRRSEPEPTKDCNIGDHPSLCTPNHM